ncbi:MAG: hypothetical protein Q9187_002707 [Circinaria calcarea]
MADYENMDNLDTSTSLDFDLYYNPNHEATLQSGGLKSYGTKEGGSAIYEKKSSGYSVTVERLLWADGWEKTTAEGEKTVHNQEMTLVVLKIVLSSHDPSRKFMYVKATLAFDDSDWEKSNGENEPRVEAWAPFHKPQRWNQSLAHHKKTDTKDGNIKLGYSGVDLSAGWSSQGEISWDRTAFDQGRSNAEISDITNNRNGVTWVLEQNQLENAGVSQELWTAVLISRPTADPYLVRFQINTRVGTIEDFKNKTKEFFGLKPDKTKPYLVTPGKKLVCNFEGHDIFKCIDLNNLGKLQGQGDRSNLDVKWGPDYKIEIPRPSKQASETLSDGTITGESAEDGWKSDKLPEEASPASTSQSASLATPIVLGGTAWTVAAPPITVPPAASGLLQVPQSSLPPMMVGWYNPTLTTNADSGRLTALEARAAQIETRIATQDSLIMQLQQALAAKDVQLSRLEQVIGNVVGG